MWWDVVCAALGVATIVYLLAGGDDFWDRNTLPNRADVFFGVDVRAARAGGGAAHVGLDHAVRDRRSSSRTAFVGPVAARASGRTAATTSSSLSGFMYQTLEGIFGTAVDVSSSLIILFTIYGAFLQHSGAGKFYLDWSFAAMGSKHSGAGRTVVLASFLLGGPSGSGVATTVTIGSVAYPMLRARGLRQGRGGRPARRRAAWARSSRRRCSAPPRS